LQKVFNALLLLKIPKIGPPFDSARAQNMDSLNVTTNQGPADRALDKPWIGPEYQPGKSAMIILHWTYYGSTEECKEAFLDGLWHDASFGVVFDEAGVHPTVKQQLASRMEWAKKTIGGERKEAS
jgi:hypothetical protein